MVAGEIPKLASSQFDSDSPCYCYGLVHKDGAVPCKHAQQGAIPCRSTESLSLMQRIHANSPLEREVIGSSPITKLRLRVAQLVERLQRIAYSTVTRLLT